MLNNLILIEDGKYKQFSTQEELVEYLLGDTYYSLSEKGKINIMKLNAVAKCYGTDIKVLDLTKKEEKKDIKNKFVIYDEITYVLSLLLTKRATLLEKTDINYFTKNMDKTNIKENYIIVNTFAESLLESYINT